jgi:RimJ/RimL family protein N-acetyltransferase
MDTKVLTVREIQEADIERIINYWLNADAAFLQGMGVDVTKLPTREQWVQMLSEQINTPIDKKRSYCIIWEVNNTPIGHCNTNPIAFGEEAYMHLHIWKPGARKKGFGVALIKRTLPYFFHQLQLQRLYSEPYALNPAPNKALEKAGFQLEKEYTTTPGYLNFEQPVKRWVLTKERFMELY